MQAISPKNKVYGENNFAGMKALIMGLGLHGGGFESARYLAEKGAIVTVTDLRDETTLKPTIEKLKAFPIRYVLGRHEIEDFRNSDIIVKNPAVTPNSPYLQAAKRIETDISLFLSACPAKLVTVTGSKGKSSVSSAIHFALNEGLAEGQTPRGRAWLGGNIAISPLSFLDELGEEDDVVLELSSWQLGDLRGRGILKPRAAVITAIMKDHLDKYDSMEAYVNDKRVIYRDQDENDVTIAADDAWGKSFLRESRGRSVPYSAKPLDSPGGWLSDPQGPGLARLWEIPGKTTEKGRVVEVVPARPLIPGFHQKQNLLIAALSLLDLGLEADFIRESLGRFPGIEHRLEFFHESGEVKFYNDSAATIPEAAAAALSAFDTPPVLVTGGADKELDFTPLALATEKAKAVILLAGTGSEKLKALLESGGVKYRGPFDSLEAAISAVGEAAAPGDAVVLSPGCASFGMFLNEFDRGQKWKAGVKKLFP
jgi:UDP-N-acetylmuramoylalanine--D-glutamate ligase